MTLRRTAAYQNMEQRKALDNTPLGKLPAELRLMIYEFVFNSLQPIRLVPVNRSMGKRVAFTTIDRMMSHVSRHP